MDIKINDNKIGECSWDKYVDIPCPIRKNRTEKMCLECIYFKEDK